MATSFGSLAASIYAFYCAIRTGPSIWMVVAFLLLLFINGSLIAMRP